MRTSQFPIVLCKSESMRTNQQWLEALSEPSPEGTALLELSQSIRIALGKVFRASNNVSDSDFDDFIQDSLIKILANLNKFRGDARFTTWASAIAIRVALTELRRRKPKDLDPQDSQSLEIADHHDPNDALERQEVLNALKKAIDQSLTPYQRFVILALLDGAPIVQVAEKLGKERNAIYKTYHDSRVRLRRALERAGYSSDSLASSLQLGGEKR